MAKQQLPIRAESDSRYYRRFILLGLGALAFAAYCVYDGAIAWPRGQKIYDAYHEIAEEDRPDQWPIVAAENGWSPEKPGKRHSDADIFFQFVMAVPISLVGLWFLFGVWRARGGWIEGTEAGITSSRGQGFNWDDVQQLDKKKWRSKGIARVVYRSGNRNKSFVLDDYKFDRQATDAIVTELEHRIPREMIINGPTEAEMLEAAETSEAAS